MNKAIDRLAWKAQEHTAKSYASTYRRRNQSLSTQKALAMLLLAQPFLPRRPASVRAPAASLESSPLPIGTSGELFVGAAVEIFYEGSLLVGNYIGLCDPAKKSLGISLSSGREVSIAADQLVGVWDYQSGRSKPPQNQAEWEPVLAQASYILTAIPSNMFTLDFIASKSVKKGKGVSCVAIADELLEKLEERHPKVHNHLAPANERDSTTLFAWWLVAGMLLSKDRLYFKRVVSNPSFDYFDNGTIAAIHWRGGDGGFRPLQRSVVNNRKETSFIETAQLLQSDMERGRDIIITAWPIVTLPILSTLEMIALRCTPCDKQMARILTKLNQTADANGARQFLLHLSLWHAGDGEKWDSYFDKNIETRIEPSVNEIQARREELEQQAPLQPAARGDSLVGKLPWWMPEANRPSWTNGRIDLRASFPYVFAIDARGTAFADDAVSYDASTRTLAVHIVDISSIVPRGSDLDRRARLRMASIYGGSNPLHMLPTTLLKSASLSADYTNECISAIFQFDEDGKVIKSNLVRSIIPKVRKLSQDDVERILGDTGIDSPIHRDLRGLSKMVKLAQEQSSKLIRRRTKGNAGAIVDLSLHLYSSLVFRFARRNFRLTSTNPTRRGTAPLRRYLDLVDQRQVAATLARQRRMSAEDVAEVDREWQEKKSLYNKLGLEDS